MASEPIQLLGGASVHCINEQQMQEAERLAYRDPESAPKISALINRLESEFTRNERAAVAFLLIKRLKDDPAV